MNNNPLKQYFRRPEIYLKLPSGGNFYAEGSIDLPENKELPIYPMTAIDEITSKTPDALFNGTAVVEIIKSCVPNIKDPWAIPSIDLDPILIAIRAASNGNLLDIESTCPSCNEEASYNVNLIGLLSKIDVGNYDEPIILNELEFKFKPFSYQKVNSINMVQFEIEQSINKLENIEDPTERQKQSGITMQRLNNLSLELITESLEFIKTPTVIVTEKEYILDFLHNCDRKIFEQLRITAVKLRESSQLKPLPVKCFHCSHDYTQKLTLNVSDFFRLRLLYLNSEDIQKLIDDMETESTAIKNTAIRYAWHMRGGATYEDILNMSSTERNNIGKLIEENFDTTKKSGLPFF